MSLKIEEKKLVQDSQFSQRFSITSFQGLLLPMSLQSLPYSHPNLPILLPTLNYRREVNLLILHIDHVSYLLGGVLGRVRLLGRRVLAIARYFAGEGFPPCSRYPNASHIPTFNIVHSGERKSIQKKLEFFDKFSLSPRIYR